MIPVIDLHCDTLSKLCSAPEDFLLPPEQGHSHITLPGLRTSDGLLQCFALFTDLAEWTHRSPLSCIEEQFDCFRSLLAASDGALVQVFTYTDILENRASGKLSALLTLEESCLSDTPADLLPRLYSLGVRMATLTWNHPNLLGYPASPSAPPLPSGFSPVSLPGLTPAGFDFLEEAERLGILIDVSHLSDAGFYDVAAHSKKPFLASHSNARAICDVPRNLTDDMLRTLAEHGGLVGLNLHEPFLVTGQASAEDVLSALGRHAKHIISVAGIDTLALGTDFDGIPGNAAIPNVSFLPRLEEVLKKAGFTSDEIEKVFYRNALRVFKECL
ncbi:MAG: dipeptidase [Lachnospiraceae bacterium]|nr:dipeptidase [Lachnospiraceae bacterium]